MGQIIRFRNNLVQNDTPKSLLSTSVSASGTTLPIQNVNTFFANWAIQIGDTGEERAEIKLLGTATPSGTALNTTAGVTFDHPSDTPVYAIKYDKLIVYKSSTGTAGVATAVTDGTISITPDSEYTQYDDTAGGTGDAYRASFMNSVLGTASETSQSDWFVPSGFSFYSKAKLRERVKRKLFNSQFINNDEIIDDWLNEWMETMNNSAVDVNKDYLIGTVDVAHGTNGLATISASDFKEIRRVWFTTNGTDFYKAERMEQIDFSPGQSFNETIPFYYPYGDDVIGKKPDGQSGTARIVYYKRAAYLSNDTDEIPVVMRSYTKSFVDYARSQAAYLDGKNEQGDRYLAQAQLGQETFKRDIAPRWKSGPQYISLVSPLDGEDDEYLAFLKD